MFEDYPLARETLLPQGDVVATGNEGYEGLLRLDLRKVLAPGLPMPERSVRR